MDFHDNNQFGNGEQEEDRASDDRRKGKGKGKKLYHRHSTHQIQQLEAFFKGCQRPDENQRIELGNTIGLEPRQIKFWFQNKRTQTKTQVERENYSALRTENERMIYENIAIQEALKNVLCQDCGGPPTGLDERENSIRQLQLQNAQLKEEHERVTNLLSRYIGKPVSEIEKLVAGGSGGSSSGQPAATGQPNVPLMIPRNADGSAEWERVFMARTASKASDELIRLLQMDEPLWAKSHSDQGFSLYRDAYERIIGRTNYLKNSSNTHFESSKYSGIVNINAMQLVDMLLDANQWVDLFPTIVAKGRTITTMDDGAIGSRHGSLQLMYGKMHVLSPLVASREFNFLRHCKQIEEGNWVIVDVSYECSRDTAAPTPNCWKLPSGCLIQDISNGFSTVTWVEHEQVDDKMKNHRFYRDLMSNNYGITYGAKKWVATLQRMGERISSYYSSIPTQTFASNNDFRGVVTKPEEKRSLMTLSHRMVKSLCETLSSLSKQDFSQSAEADCSGVRVSVERRVGIGQPIGIVVTTSTSLWLPLPPYALFDFITNEESRIEWDVLSNGLSVHDVSRITTGVQPGNYISVRRPFITTENSAMVLQESCVDSTGSMMIVYAPIDFPGLEFAVSGEDTSDYPILPSGLIISGDGRASTAHDLSAASSSAGPPPEGSILTVALQILVSDSHNMNSVAIVNALVSSTVQQIKAALKIDNNDLRIS